MSRNLMIVTRHKPSRLAATRRLAHRLLARAAFVVETLAVTAFLFGLMTLALLRANRVLVAHEWGLFLTHYATASVAAREPVDRTVGAGLAALAVFVGLCRWPAARLVWRARDRGEV
jgi:hypothetical protein